MLNSCVSFPRKIRFKKIVFLVFVLCCFKLITGCTVKGIQEVGEEQNDMSVSVIVREIIDYDNSIILVEGKDKDSRQAIDEYCQLDCKGTVIQDTEGKEVEFSKLQEYDVLQVKIEEREDIRDFMATHIIRTGEQAQRITKTFDFSKVEKIIGSVLLDSEEEELVISDKEEVSEICKQISSLEWERLLIANTQWGGSNQFSLSFYDGTGNEVDNVIISGDTMVYEGPSDEGELYFYQPAEGEFNTSYIGRLFGKRLIGETVEFEFDGANRIEITNNKKGDPIEINDEKILKKILKDIVATSWKLGKSCNTDDPNEFDWKYRLDIQKITDSEIHNKGELFLLSKDTIVYYNGYYRYCEWKAESGEINMELLKNLILKNEGKNEP